ncbi:endonuclease [Allopusillimonas ginsengisoli]|uniref:endonuclease n=1 Tax=Allopusillimonas ginsengisoli TaxID=453575 RepID=UPI0010203A71|nr:endonuclease [Allopusillimonas ginsengisoli]TEA78653.1 endonuclease [Allopusillimonas ginsengisoli]
MQLDRLTITLPWVDSRLMPNRKNGLHWGRSQEAKVRARQDGHMSALVALGRNTMPLSTTIPVKITFAAPDGRHRDLDNLLAASKASLDGIAKALGVDDKCFRPLTIDAAIDTRKQGFVIVEIGL